MADTGKKRKRNTDGTARPSKKVAIPATPQATTASVSVLPDSDDWTPLIVSTPGLAVSPSIPLHPYTKRRKNVPSSSGPIASHELLLHSSEHPTVDYTGREDDSGVSNLLKHYVGVYDPATGKLKLVEARRMTVRGLVRAQKARPEALVDKASLSNMRDLRNNLGETFGTKKARKAIASMTENAIAPPRSARQLSPGGSQPKLDSVSRAMLASMAEATAGMATREELQAAIDDAKPRPKADLAAQNVKDVYTIENLIGFETMKSIPAKDWQDAVKAKKEIITISKYVSNRLIKTSSDLQRLRVLRYLLCLLEFLNATKPRRSTRSLPPRNELASKVPGIPSPILEGIKRKFSSQGEMLSTQVDLLITTICALALIVDNFEVDMYDLAEDLKLEAKQLSQYFREIGARVGPMPTSEGKKLGLDKAAMAQRKFAKLKLPLEFPKTRFVRSR
ncbi:MAG: DNA-directed RNA polymerase I subunit rpa49 [Claussenomyces sp. TS43310]|nr:MAG: DNA-directed RNA polymerase I subunit rpa49 [Claussenomyces sp. TS43310]